MPTRDLLLRISAPDVHMHLVFLSVFEIKSFCCSKNRNHIQKEIAELYSQKQVRMR
jgi:hypothetical protein